MDKFIQNVRTVKCLFADCGKKTPVAAYLLSSLFPSWAVAERFMALVTASSPPDENGLGDLATLAGVRNYPGWVKCATLPWHALRSAIGRS
jgi:nitrogen fixation NifU-like protein